MLGKFRTSKVGGRNGRPSLHSDESVRDECTSISKTLVMSARAAVGKRNRWKATTSEKDNVTMIITSKDLASIS